MSAELETIEESIKIALDAADAATDITSEYNKVKREHKKLEAKVKQIHRYTTIIFGSSIVASIVAIGFSSVLYFKSMSDLSVMTTTNREALVIFAENVDALKETTNNLKMAMDNQALIQDQNKKDNSCSNLGFPRCNAQFCCASDPDAKKAAEAKNNAETEEVRAAKGAGRAGTGGDWYICSTA